MRWIGSLDRVATWLIPVGQALRDHRGNATTNKKKSVSMPPCVWYGRATFCMHFPECSGARSHDVRDERGERVPTTR